MTRLAIIYSLHDPRDPAPVRYIGCTMAAGKRMKAHTGAPRPRRPHLPPSPRWAWRFELHALGLAPIFRIMEECPASEMKARERAAIARARASGEPLLNGTAGGDGPNP